ncbi:hypothetical protein F2P45_11015 [Massilia sp. CCM 8733]|uniref:Uncharacterized protein n=1 Tax=Massilia mucilaginosa TaxID=2609282 RepID=A0ABX0NS16_9BURK|nr:hypothetical protein [Massilia mucilaginosa]NHZ89540.1 hypothetical protein [Massilia mucilaginosa]
MPIPTQCQALAEEIQELQQERADLQAELQTAPTGMKAALANQIIRLSASIRARQVALTAYTNWSSNSDGISGKVGLTEPSFFSCVAYTVILIAEMIFPTHIVSDRLTSIRERARPVKRSYLKNTEVSHAYPSRSTASE